jgi:Ca2+-binding RTX toxin-like protein
MSTFTAYNALGQGMDMSGLTNGHGVFLNNGSMVVRYIRDIDANTALFAVTGVPRFRYATVSIGDIAANGDVLITDIHYYNSNFNYLLRWDKANIVGNIYDDFSFGTVLNVLRGPDQITGNDYNDIIKGGYGNDRLSGLGGNDHLYGEGNNDYLTGGAGKDTLVGGAGSDVLRGDSGEDTLVWDSSDAQLHGGTGYDWLQCGSLDLTRVANNRIVSVEFVDTLNNKSGTVTLNARDILDMSATDILGVLGDFGDRVNIVGSFRFAGESGGIETYKFGGATLLVNSEVLVY